MNGLRFEQLSQVVAAGPLRTDVACFVGFVPRRATPVPKPLERWLRERGYAAGSLRDVPVPTDTWDLRDVPVPIDTWDHFDHLFAWDQRLPASVVQGGTYLGAAVRSYFAQGGRKCYVLRSGDPWRLESTRAQRLAAMARVFPGYQRSPAASPADRESWRGIAHIFGLPDVSFLCTPDLGDAVQSDLRRPVLTAPTRPHPPEQFVECAPDETPPRPAGFLSLPAPRADAEGFQEWSALLLLGIDLIRRFRRDVQLVAAVPMPAVGEPAAAHLLNSLIELGYATPASRDQATAATAFLQLAYPWVRTRGSARLPEGIESPDAVLAGVLARNALVRGTTRSAAGLHLADAYELVPALDRRQTASPATIDPPNSHGRLSTARRLADKVSLLGPTPSGPRLLSDVTTSEDPSYRPAAVNRLVSTLVRAARDLGEEHAFENSGERLWALLEQRVARLLDGLFLEGAFRGATPAEAFEITCDRTTMTQNDIDSGRVIVRVRFQPAFSIESITVMLALNEGGQASLVESPRQDAA